MKKYRIFLVLLLLVFQEPLETEMVGLVDHSHYCHAGIVLKRRQDYVQTHEGSEWSTLACTSAVGSDTIAIRIQI